MALGHTWRPASLLWRFMAERASGRFSRASANSRDTIPPNSMSSLQPPHFQPSPGVPWWRVLQPQMAAEPSAQERVTAKATPAEAMAWTKADSRVAMGKEEMGVSRQSRAQCARTKEKGSFSDEGLEALLPVPWVSRFLPSHVLRHHLCLLLAVS